MKKVFKGILISTVISTVVILLLIFTHNTDLFGLRIKADEADWSQTEEGEGTGDPGGAGDSFTILEIVPYRGLSEIGYLIGGQEPVKEQYLPSNYQTTAGELSFLGGAITVYRSHVEGALPASGTADTGWTIAKTPVTQNGYFENVGNNKGGRYSMSQNKDSYVSVQAGTGNYNAVLSGEMENVYNIYNDSIIHRKNVDVYFVLGKPSGVPLYNNGAIAYEPYSVSKNATTTGDYDYNCETGTFRLNKGKGAYDVIFMQSYGNSKLYYMTSDIKIVEDNSGDYSWNLSYVAQTGGNYNKINGTTFTYDRYNGAYRWVQDDDALTKPSNYYEENGKIWVRGQKALTDYQFTDRSTFVNNEWFKRFSLGVSADKVKDYPVKVITLTPEELNKPENQHYITEANLFYINASIHNSAYISLYEKYNEEGRSLSENEKKEKQKKDNLNFAIHDLTWSNVELIFKRAAGVAGYRAAVVIDNTFFQEAINGSGPYNNCHESVSVSYTWNSNGATKCNLAKLYIMLYQRNMPDFYNAFMNSTTSHNLITKEVNSSAYVSGSTGSFIRPDSSSPTNKTAKEAIYWNGNTFVPYGLDDNGNMIRFSQDKLNEVIPNFNITATTTDIIQNVLVLGGQPIFTNVFNGSIGLSAGQLQEAIIHLSSLDPNGNLVNPSDITIADLINVITNNGIGYGNNHGGSEGDGGEDGTSGSNLRTYTSVLNIQPTADFTVSEAKIRALLDGYNLRIVNMTSVQFNGSLEDINTHYDLIYMGNGNSRFNLDSGITSFNDISLNKYSYFSTGDEIKTSAATKRYTGNDITDQKKKELESFIVAGYPIILENSLYQLTDVVKANTKLYTFINNAKGHAVINLLNLADTGTDADASKKLLFYARLKRALNINRPMIRLINPTISGGAPVDYVYVDAATGLLVIQFALLPKGIIPSNDTYNAYLYLDKNGDGEFTSAEKLTAVSSNHQSWLGIRESKFIKYAYSYHMNNLNGVYCWKIIVEKENTEIRSEVTGYVANTKKQDINILQIRKDTSVYSLENKANDQASRTYEYTMENVLKDYNIHFKTLTVAEFESLYVNKKYTTEAAATTNQLSKYHLLILDNQDKIISNQNGAVTNIKDEIAKDLGVVITKDSINFSNQLNYLSDNVFLENDSYNQLNQMAKLSPLQKYIFSNLFGSSNPSNQEASYLTTYATKANEGSITRYPYQINSAIQIASNSYSEDTTMDLKLGITEEQPLIGWYCLSDSKSPVVRSAGLANGGSDTSYQGIYSSSPNDVKNNYYLFSRGNCYYSGIQLSNADAKTNENDTYDDEMKLFINTIIAVHKSSNRTIASQPSISIINPVPIGQSITIIPDHITDNKFVMTFEISDSSSDMDVTILLDNVITDPCKNIYKVDGANVVSDIPISIEDEGKSISNGTYAIKIPIDDLIGTHSLKISAENVTNNVTSTEVDLHYANDPIVTIIDPIPITNGSDQYLYADMDYSVNDTVQIPTSNDEKLRVEFEVTGITTDITLKINGSSLMTGDLANVSVYSIAIVNGVEVESAIDLSATTSPGKFALYLPMTLMQGKSSKDITITATGEDNNSGETTVTLLRRSLFPLD